MSQEWKFASWVSTLGKWAWVIGIVSGIVDILIAIYSIAILAALPFGAGAVYMGYGVWWLIAGILEILISFFVIRPKFSNKCANKDWDSLYEWILPLGSIRFPWMLIWGIITEVLGYGWGGFGIIIPALILIFAGPKPYKWKTEKQ